jgi:type I restriction enzyme, R subunit
LAQKVKTVVEDKIKYTYLSKRDCIKAELKVDLIILLPENNYPPVDRDDDIKRFLNRQRILKSESVANYL